MSNGAQRAQGSVEDVGPAALARRRGRVDSVVRDAQRLVERYPGARAWRVDRLHVVQRDAGEEPVHAQRHPFQLSLSEIWGMVYSFSNALSFAG